MNRLIIVGNGFDLAHGLKTGYMDFMLDYLKSAFSNADYQKPYEDELIRIEQEWGYAGFSEHGIATVGDLLRISARHHFTIHYKSAFMRLIVNGSHINNWVDIENIYFLLLSDIAKSSKSHNEQLTLLNADLTHVKRRLRAYLTKINTDYEFDIDSSICHQFRTILTQNVWGGRHTPDRRFDEIEHVKIVNFNYTDLISTYLKIIENENIEEIQIHGNLSDSPSMVFGFGDEVDSAYQVIEDLNNNKFFEHVKSFQYLQNSAYQNLMEFVKNGELEVYVLGHSLGLSDRTMLSQIFELSNVMEIRFFYYENMQGMNDYTTKAFEISRHFKNKARMREIIVPFDKCKPMPQYLKTSVRVETV